MSSTSIQDRLSRLDTNMMSDAMDFLALGEATYGLQPVWDCPKIVGRASTVEVGPQTNATPAVHLLTPVIDAVQTDDRIIVISGGIDGIPCCEDILANASKERKFEPPSSME